MPTRDLTAAADAGIYIDRVWSPGAGNVVDVSGPYDGSVLVSNPGAGETQTRAALASAQAAQVGWARQTPMYRGGLLRQIADVIAANRDELIDLLVAEVGKRRSEAADELAFAEGFMRYN